LRPVTTKKQPHPLLDSAQAFLSEALHNFSNEKLSFAIVHAVTATELVLKERLARVNPALIFADIDKADPRNRRTVSLAALPQRLANLGLALADDQAKLIKTFADWRNEIIHHAPTHDAIAVRQQLPKLLDFLAAFLRDVLKKPLEKFLPRDLYRVANGLLDDWKKAVRSAQAEAAAAGGVRAEVCPLCGAESVLGAGGKKDLHCFLCESEFYLPENCEGCGAPLLRTAITAFTGENYCDDCIEAAGEAYVQMMRDEMRGK
jgi:hypothetical protein